MFLRELFSKVNYMLSCFGGQILAETHVLDTILQELISDVWTLLAERVLDQVAILSIDVCLAQGLLHVFQVGLE